MFWCVAEARIRNFKSFGPEAVHFRFQSPYVVGIVGPNGAGKSNVLDALCFASGCPASVLRVKTLKELVHQDSAAELCEVEFGIAQALPGMTQPGCPLHWIRAALTKEGFREFKIDGKMKSAQHVQAFLHSHSLYLDSESSVIRQAQVTRLADSNNAAPVADVIAEASGLSRWNQEAARASGELVTTKRALIDIQSNIKKLQQAVGQDEEKVQQRSRAQALDIEVDATAEHMAARLTGQLGDLAKRIRGTSAQQARLQADAREATEKLQKMEEEAREVQELLKHGHKQEQGAAIGRRILKISQNVAALENQAQTLSEEVASAQQLEQQAQVHAANMQQLRCQLGELSCLMQAQAEQVQQLQDLQDNVLESPAAGGLQDLHTIAASAQARQKEVQEQLDSHQEMYQHAQHVLNHAEAELTRVQADKAASITTAKTLKAAATRLVSSIPGAEGLSASDAVMVLTQLLEEAETRASAIRMRHQVLQTTSGYDPANPSTAPKLLHQCFRFKQPQVCESSSQGSVPAQSPSLHSLLKALATIAGSSMDVVVCATRSDASRLLEDAKRGVQVCRTWGPMSKLKIWPLDSISPADRTARWKAAVQTLGSGKAWLPLELLEPTQPAYAAALRKAFGHMVIAADQEAALHLSAAHGLPCVTLDGLVSRPGSVTGGWQGNHMSRGETALSQKLQIEENEFAQVVAAGEIARLTALLRQAQKAEADLEAAAEATEMLLACEEEAKQRVLECSAEASKLQQQCRQMQAEAEAALVTSAAYAAALAQQTCPASASRPGTLDENLNLAKATLQNLRSSHMEAEMKLEELEAQQEEVMCRLASYGEQGQPDQAAAEAAVVAGSDDEGHQQHHAGLPPQQMELHRQSHLGSVSAAKELRLAQVNVHLGELRLQLQSARQQEDKLHSDAAAARKKLNQLAQDIKSAKAESVGSVHAAAELDTKLQAAFQCQRQAQAALTSLLTTFPHIRQSALVTCGDAGADGCHSGDATAVMEGTEVLTAEDIAQAQCEVRSFSSQLKKLLAEKSRLKAIQVPLAEQALQQDRVDTLQQLKERYAALSTAVETLEQGIDEERKQVLQANADAFTAVASRFQQLCLLLLPSMTISLVKAEDCPSKGVTVQFLRTAHDGSIATAGKDPMAGTLEELSGGQRTLVSLALLLAAAQEGSHSSVLLLDEVDAALDEHNQSSVARLLHELSHSGQVVSGAGAADAHSQGAQLLCVSHNKAFLKACDARVHVSRSKAGGSIVEAMAGSIKAAAAIATWGNPRQEHVVGKHAASSGSKATDKASSKRRKRSGCR